jgi:pimeloyl-ACP methyl ester carboxylesterase
MSIPNLMAGDGASAACANGSGLLQIETPRAVPLADALTRWTNEARFGTCPTGQYRMPYFVWGTGPPLVFIHGLADMARSFVLVMHALREHFTCVAYELPAGGTDQARLGAYRHRHMVADLFALLDYLGFPRSYLFGSSFGSTIALAAMNEQPNRIPRAVLQGGFACRSLARWERSLCSFVRYFPGPMSTLPLRSRLAYPAERQRFANCRDLWEFLQSNSGSQMKSAVARRGLMILDIDLRPLLPRIRQPVLMLCGAHDPIVPRVCEAPLLEGLPHVERVEFPDCGHFPQYTHAPLVAELARRFLTAPQCPA